MASRLDELEVKYGKCLAECARLNRRIDELHEDMKTANRNRESMRSETSISWRPAGIRATMKAAPWVFVTVIAIVALVVALIGNSKWHKQEQESTTGTSPSNAH